MTMDDGFPDKGEQVGGWVLGPPPNFAIWTYCKSAGVGAEFVPPQNLLADW